MNQNNVFSCLWYINFQFGTGLKNLEENRRLIKAFISCEIAYNINSCKNVRAVIGFLMVSLSDKVFCFFRAVSSTDTNTVL